MARPLESPAQGEELREKRLRLAVVALAGLPAVVMLAAELGTFGNLAGFPLDDPWIHLTFARRLAAGDGLAYRSGQLVAGSTAPLWTALLALLFRLPGALATWAQLAGVALHVVGLGLVFRLARRLDLAPRAAALATLLVGLTDGLVLSAPSGMEMPLFVVLFCAGLLLHLDERRRPAAPPRSFLVWALAALTRPEGLLLPLLAAVDRAFVVDDGGWRLDRRGSTAALRGIGLALVVLVPVGLVFQGISGSPFPTTLHAKSAVSPALLPPLRHLSGALGALFAAQPAPTLLAAGGAVVLLLRLGGPRDRGLLLPLWTFALPVAIAMLSDGGPLLAGNFGRYLFPALPGVVLLGTIAVEPLIGGRETVAARHEAGALPLPVVVTVAALLLVPALLRTSRMPGFFVQARSNVEASDERAAAWLAAHAPADALVAALDVGVLGWRLPNPLLDLGGIVSPERRERLDRAAAEDRPWQTAIEEWLAERRPEYVVVFPRWLPELEGQPRSFPSELRLPIDRNVAMGGDELVVYSTPWTRAKRSPTP